MCRYAFHTYKSHFACFECRKAFKKTPIDDYVAHQGLQAAWGKIVAAYHSPQKRRRVEAELDVTYEQIEQRYLADVSVCPQCSGRMAAMGLDFRAPRMADVEAWSIIRELYDHGFAFQGCGCYVGYVPPSKKSEISEWIKQHKRASDGELLLAAIEKRQL